jgi:probable F420-dependent oxidoreductase
VGRFKVGVQIEPQHCSVDELRAAWRAADALGVDSIFTWDHFFPLHGDPDGTHYEGWSLLAAMACDTSHASVGLLVSCASYRNPDLTADMARTLDHVSGGRLILGLGAGWCERDYDEYGFAFGTPGSRLRALERDIVRIRARLRSLSPPPRGPLPLMIGGEGERVTLRLTAEHADMWNGFGPIEKFTHKNGVLNEWCGTFGRDPAAIERTVLLNQPGDVDGVDAYVEAGAQRVIVPARAPFDLSAVERVLALRGV